MNDRMKEMLEQQKVEHYETLEISALFLKLDEHGKRVARAMLQSLVNLSKEPK